MAVVNKAFPITKVNGDAESQSCHMYDINPSLKTEQIAKTFSIVRLTECNLLS
jgi:hypothetical protein